MLALLPAVARLRARYDELAMPPVKREARADGIDLEDSQIRSVPIVSLALALALSPVRKARSTRLGERTDAPEAR